MFEVSSVCFYGPWQLLNGVITGRSANCTCTQPLPVRRLRAPVLSTAFNNHTRRQFFH